MNAPIPYDKLFLIKKTGILVSSLCCAGLFDKAELCGPSRGVLWIKTEL